MEWWMDGLTRSLYQLTCHTTQYIIYDMYSLQFLQPEQTQIYSSLRMNQARERLAEFREDVRDTMVRLGLRIKPDASFECSADRKLVGVKCLSAAHRQTFLLEVRRLIVVVARFWLLIWLLE